MRTAQSMSMGGSVIQTWHWRPEGFLQHSWPSVYVKAEEARAQYHKESQPQKQQSQQQHHNKDRGINTLTRRSKGRQASSISFSLDLFISVLHRECVTHSGKFYLQLLLPRKALTGLAVQRQVSKLIPDPVELTFKLIHHRAQIRSITITSVL